MKREHSTQTLTLEPYQNRTRSLCILLALLLSCCLTGLRAPFVSTLPLLVLTPFACMLWLKQPVRILLFSLPCGLLGGLFSGNAASLLFLALLSLLGAGIGVGAALLFRLAFKQGQAALKILLAAAGTALLFIAGYASFNLFGNPVSFISTAVRANSYVSEMYPEDRLVFSGVVYNSKQGRHSAVYSLPGEANETATVSFDRKGNVLDGYQERLSGEFCREQAVSLSALLTAQPDGFPLSVTADAAQELGLTRNEKGSAFDSLESGKEKANERRESARAKLCYTLTFRETSGEISPLTKQQLLDQASAVQRELSRLSYPYQEITLLAADGTANVQRVRFSPSSSGQEIAASHRAYDPNEK